MAYLKVDDNVSHHRKLLRAGDVAAWLFICGLAYCQRHATDGFIPAEALPFLGCVGWKAAAPRLVEAQLWHQTAAGYEVHDFLDWNDSAAERDFKGEIGRRRVELFRDPELRAAIRHRDGDNCRYCSRLVQWHDRRGPAGGTYDHVDPAKGNELDNLVVCCRSCNSRKQRRTPEQAGMTLLAPKSDQAPIYIGSRSDLGPPSPTPTPTPETERTTPPKSGGTAHTWKRSLAIAHKAIEAHPTSMPDQADWFKATCAAQGIDYTERGGDDQRPLYTRALDAALETRERRARQQRDDREAGRASRGGLRL